MDPHNQERSLVLMMGDDGRDGLCRADGMMEIGRGDGYRRIEMMIGRGDGFRRIDLDQRDWMGHLITLSGWLIPGACTETACRSTGQATPREARPIGGAVPIQAPGRPLELIPDRVTYRIKPVLPNAPGDVVRLPRSTVVVERSLS